MTGYLNAVYFRQGLTCTIRLTNDLDRRWPTKGYKQFLKRDLASIYMDGI